MDDQHIKDCPRTVNVKAGAHPSQTIIENFNFLVQTRDKKANNLTVGGMNVVTTITHDGNPVECKQTDQNNGLYLIEYTLPVPIGATYLISTSIDDQPIRGAPWEQRV